MTILDLTGYSSVQSAYFVRIDVPTYQVLLFSNFDYPYTIDSEDYVELGKLMGVSGSQSELRVSDQEITVTISGVPAGSVSEVLDNPMKGSPITIRRGFFNITTGALLPVANNPAIKFKGLVNNVSLTEVLNQEQLNGTFTIQLVCTGTSTLFKNKISGRRTNPLDELKWFPGDNGFKRVPTLSNANFHFGKPRVVTTAGVS